ncbi:hypothetical protein Ciccas_009918 [Cichlidogyrus casuarinus]|uniref:Uncharacterized protein n=1 Tax=Cichlidogyrus casuarinus TaxID=1844966 RepID=A0ABD2PXI1_9PLAT
MVYLKSTNLLLNLTCFMNSAEVGKQKFVDPVVCRCFRIHSATKISVFKCFLPDFSLVVRAYIYNVTRHRNGDNQYLIYVIDVYKDDKDRLFKKDKLMEMVHHCDKSQAGLQLYQTYLLTGIYKDGRAFLDSCSWKKTAREVTAAQWKFVQVGYARNCALCQVKRVFSRFHYKMETASASTSECFVSLDPRSNEATCRDRFSICRFNPINKSCAFYEMPRYSNCLNWLFR